MLSGLWARLGALAGRRKCKAKKLGLALTIGGGMSNWYDRHKRGYVTDYVSFRFGPEKFRRLVFNVSDFCIFFGLALLTAIYQAFFCPKNLYRIVKPAVELLAGIPSVVYGFFGIVVLVPMVRALGEPWDGSGNSMLTASILLAIMILPTIIGVVEPALRAVPKSYYEGALALGATHERSVYTAVVPAASSGILAGIVLGIGRAMGETMAVIMVAGNQPRMPKGILQGVRTLTGNIVIEMGYAAGLHREALIATGVVLFVFILLINLSFSALKRRKKA